MLREILLSLSGLPSPIWDNLSKDGDKNQGTGSPNQYSSPAERQMLGSLGELARLHHQLKEQTDTVSKTHNSPACRAVSNRIASSHLRSFTSKIIEVEATILREDAKFVGAYKIVPLSTLVTEFQPWLRPLRWFSKTLSVFVSTQPTPYTTSKLLEYLQKERQTGYLDIKEIATDLLVAGEKAWIQSMIPWLLYGQLPTFGSTDFMIQPSMKDTNADYSVHNDLKPFFLTGEAAEAILAAGKALVQLRSGSWSRQAGSRVSCNTLMPQALHIIKSLNYPLQANNLTSAACDINEFISQAALSHLLPVDMLLDLIQVVQDYILLREGEFGSCLINHAERPFLPQQASGNAPKPGRHIERHESLTLTADEMSDMLTRTWSDLAAISLGQESVNDLRRKAAQWLRFRFVDCILPVNTLVPAQAGLMLDFPPESPLSLFLSNADRQRYCQLSVYLLSMHKARANLASLWTIPGYRRMSNRATTIHRRSTRAGVHEASNGRGKGHVRDKLMRSPWACASLVMYLLSELCSYFYGEIIENSWVQFNTWLKTRITGQPGSSPMTSRPTTASAEDSAMSSSQSPTSSAFRTDPRIIALAHHEYLGALYHNLLLDNEEYTLVIREFLHTVEHYVALFQRLQVAWQRIDLQDDRVSDTSLFCKKEEQEVLGEISRTSTMLKEQVDDLVTTIRDADQQRDLEGVSATLGGLSMHGGSDVKFEPWRARSLERLLMKLDNLGLNQAGDDFQDALIDVHADEG